MKFLLPVLLIFISLQVSAYDGWSTGEITRIRIQSDKILVNQTTSSNPASCTNTDYIHLSQNDTPYHKNMFSSLLTAYAAKKTVSLAISGCSTGGYPAISEVWIR